METVKQPGWRLQTKAQVSWGQIKKAIKEMLTEYAAFNFRKKAHAYRIAFPSSQVF